ncbi:MAG: hypothetical protein RLN76_10420 [Phycisphaeraceae bacterium]
MWPFSSKTKPKSRARAKTTKQPAWDTQRTARGLKVVGGAALLLAIVFGWDPAERALNTYLTERSALATDAAHVVLIDQPDWMSEVVANELRRLVAERLTPDRLDQQGVAIAAEAIAANAWIENVLRLRRLTDGGAEVHATYRQPVAVLQGRDGFFLVDNNGIRLPGVYTQAQATRIPLPLITGVNRPTPVPGKTWNADEVEAGIRLAMLVQAETYADQVIAFDVSQRDRQGRVRLVMHTAKGQVRWGLPPGEERAIEHPADVKLGWLREVASERGTIDAGGAIVDLYTPAIQVSKMP